MADPIDVTDAELMALMDDLEAITGTSTAPAPSPVSVSADALAELELLNESEPEKPEPKNEEPVLDEAASELIVIDELAALEELNSIKEHSSAVAREDQLLSDDEVAELEAISELNASAAKLKAEKPKVSTADLQAGLAALKGATTNDTSGSVADSNVDQSVADELAALEQELSTKPAPSAAPEPTAAVGVAVSGGTSSTAASPSETYIGGSSGAEKSFKTLHWMIDPAVFKAETAVLNHDLDKCFTEQSSLRAYYGTLAARAEAQAATKKAQFEVLEAKIFAQIRAKLEITSAKVTEKAVENAVKMDSRWLAAKEIVIEAEGIAAINKSLAVSLGDRRDMLIQLGADRRGNAQGELRMSQAQELRERAVNSATALKEQM